MSSKNVLLVFFNLIILLKTGFTFKQMIGIAKNVAQGAVEYVGKLLRGSHRTLENLLNATFEVTGGVVNNLPGLLPTERQILDTPIQLLVGYPSEAVFSAIDHLCSFTIQNGAIKSKYKATKETVELQLHTKSGTFYHKLDEVQRLVNNKDFKRNKEVVILTAGWTSNPNSSDIVDQMSKAYLCRDKSNFLVYDAASSIDTIYSWSAFNTDSAGYYLSKYLIELIKYVPLKNIHLMGHSLGAQISSYGARYFRKETGKALPHLTGLDPAKPCFNEGETLSGLMRGDAKFVDIIHSNPGVLGKREPIGDVDLYLNGFAPMAPGCLTIICSHGRSWEVYAETVYPGNEKNVMAKRCNSLNKLEHGACVGKPRAMGYAIDKSLVGNYFTETNAQSPYGKGGSKKREAANEKCGLQKKYGDNCSRRY